MIAILMVSANLPTPCLLKIKVFWNKCYDVIISVHDVDNKIFPHDSKYIVDVFMWPKFVESNVYIIEVIVSKFYFAFKKIHYQMSKISKSCYTS